MAYNDQEIEHVGICILKCTHKEVTKRLRFFLAKVQGPTIIGLNDSKAMRLVIINCSVSRLDVKPTLQVVYGESCTLGITKGVPSQNPSTDKQTDRRDYTQDDQPATEFVPAVSAPRLATGETDRQTETPRLDSGVKDTRIIIETPEYDNPDYIPDSWTTNTGTVRVSSVQDDKPIISSKERLKDLFPDRFQGIGTLKGEYHIETDPSVTPTQQQSGVSLG